MKDEALKLALAKIKSARDCHPNAVQTLIWEAEEILEQALAAPVQERNFCERCGKRLGDLIHTCTPPAALDLQAELDATNRQVEILSDALAESRREVAKLKELNT